MIRKVIQLDGGLGRVLCAEPAIRLIEDDFLVDKKNPPNIITGWPEVFYNNPHVHKVYRPDHDWLYEDVIRHGEYMFPEPYQSHYFYGDDPLHISDVFHLLINKGDLDPAYPRLYPSGQETAWARDFTAKIREASGRPCVVAFQPFGSSYDPKGDPSNRSLSMETARKLADAVDPKKIMLLNCGHVDLDHPNVWWKKDMTRRDLLVVPLACDGYLSVDTLLAHTAVAYDLPGVTLFGGTHPKRFGWPSEKRKMITRKGYPKSYYPFRFSGYLEKNEGAMDFTGQEIEDINLALRSVPFVPNIDPKPSTLE